MTPNEQQRKFLEHLFRPDQWEEHKVEIRGLYNDTEKGERREERRWATSVDEALEHIAALQRINEGRESKHLNIYVGATARKRDATKGRKVDVASANAFWLDVDHVEDADALMQQVDGLEVKPTQVVQTSAAGFHFYYRLDTCQPVDTQEARDNFETALRGFGKQFGADDCWNIDRIMRMPGTTNYPNAKKRTEGREVEESVLLEVREHLDERGNTAPDEVSAAAFVQYRELGRKAKPRSNGGAGRGGVPKFNVLPWDGQLPEQYSPLLNSTTAAGRAFRACYNRTKKLYKKNEAGAELRDKDGLPIPDESRMDWRLLMQLLSQDWATDPNILVACMKASHLAAGLIKHAGDDGYKPDSYYAHNVWKALTSKARERGEMPDQVPVIYTNTFMDPHDLAQRVLAVAETVSGDNAPILMQRDGQPVHLKAYDDEAKAAKLVPTDEDFRMGVVQASLSVRLDQPHQSFGQVATLDQATLKSLRHLMAQDLPPVESLVYCPTLRQDGTIFDTPGYDRRSATRYVALTSASKLAPGTVPDQPTREQAIAARTHFVEGLLSDYCFVTEADRDNYLALFISLLTRRLFRGAVPFWLFNSPTKGSGKTMAVQLAAIITQGTKLPTKIAPTCNEETDKRITTDLLSSPPAVLVDNVTGTLGGDAWNALATCDGIYEGRKLHTNTNQSVRNTAVWCFTGNRLQITDDLDRRVILVNLDSDWEVPWCKERVDTFKHLDLEGHAAVRRLEYLADLLTMARGWYMWDADLEEKMFTRNLLGTNYMGWSRVVGGILDYTTEGETAFLDNAGEASQDLSADSDVRADCYELLYLWRRLFGAKPMELRTVGGLLIEHSRHGDEAWLRLGLHTALRRMLFDDGREESQHFNRQVGDLFRSELVGVVYGPFKLVQHSKHSTRARWLVEFNPDRTGCVRHREMEDPFEQSPADHTWMDSTGERVPMGDRTDEYQSEAILHLQTEHQADDQLLQYIKRLLESWPVLSKDSSDYVSSLTPARLAPWVRLHGQHDGRSATSEAKAKRYVTEELFPLLKESPQDLLRVSDGKLLATDSGRQLLATMHGPEQSPI